MINVDSKLKQISNKFGYNVDTNALTPGVPFSDARTYIIC